jgi:hypothetical protein
LEGLEPTILGLRDSFLPLRNGGTAFTGELIC